MPTLTFLNETYTCAKAQKGYDFVRLLDENNIPIFYADGISDFTPYVLTDGEWEPPLAVVAPSVSAYATLNGSVVVLDIPASVKVESGLLVNFTAPCDCTAITKMSVGGIEFDLVNSMDEVVGTYGAFRGGVKISAVLSVETNKAYLQNVGVTRVENGSYVGTGKHGSANQNSITFSFVPKFLFVIRDNRYIAVTSASHTQNDMVWIEGMVKDRDNNLAENYRRYSRTNNTVYWYSETSEDNQMNTSGTKYFYFAIG